MLDFYLDMQTPGFRRRAEIGMRKTIRIAGFQPLQTLRDSFDFKWKRRPLLLSFLQRFLCCQLPLLEKEEHYRCSPWSSLEQRRHTDRCSFRISASSSLFPLRVPPCPTPPRPTGIKERLWRSPFGVLSTSWEFSVTLSLSCPYVFIYLAILWIGSINFVC